MRAANSDILPDERGRTCAGFLLRAAKHFANHGVEHIHHVIANNAWAYRNSLGQAVNKLGAKQVVIRPHSPWHISASWLSRSTRSASDLGSGPSVAG